MSLIWKKLEWELPLSHYSHLSNESKILSVSFSTNISIFMLNTNITSHIHTNKPLRLDKATFQVSSTEKSTLTVFQTNENVFSISKDGVVYCLPKSGQCDMEIGEDETMESDDEIWKFMQNVGPILAATGTEKGFAALKYENDCIYVYIYELNITRLEFEVIKTKKILPCMKSEEKYILEKFNSNEISKELSAQLLGPMYVNCEILIISIPNSFTYLLSMLENLQQFELYYSKDVMSKIELANGKIFLLSDSGKIVQISYKNGSINYKTSYLPTNNCTISLHIFNTVEYIVWSDLENLYYSKVSDEFLLTPIIIKPFLRGIQHLFRVENNLIALNHNRNFYEIIKGESKNDDGTFLSQSYLLNNIYKVGLSIAQLNTDIEHENDKLNALALVNQPVAKDIIVSVDRSSDGYVIGIKNRSKFTFQEKYWKFHVQCVKNNKKIIKMIKLDCDFVPGDSTTFNIISGGKLKIYLLGFIDDSSKLLKIELSFDDQKFILSDNDVKEKLSLILKRRLK